MAPKAQRYREETSLSSNWRFGPHHLMAVLGVLEMIVGVVFFYGRVSVMCGLGGGRGCEVILHIEDAPKEGGLWS